jgi:hypothetical protein
VVPVPSSDTVTVTRPPATATPGHPSRARLGMAYHIGQCFLDDGQQVRCGNAIMSTFTQAAVVVGPALAGGLTAVVGPGWVIAADAASFAGPGGDLMDRLARSATAVFAAPAAATGGWRTTVSQLRLLGLLAVTCVFFFLYGPVEVALPVHVAGEIHGSAGLLGLYWTVTSAVRSAGSTPMRHKVLVFTFVHAW